MKIEDIKVGQTYRRVKVRNTAVRKIVAYLVVRLFEEPDRGIPMVRYEPLYDDGNSAVQTTCAAGYFIEIATI